MQAAAQVIPFQFETHEVRAYSDEAGEPWFCAADVCRVLGYANSRDAMSKHCREAGVAKRDISSGGQKRSTTFINEGNLYRLIIKSRKEEAQRFESWVCDEVLPAIRKTGSYRDEAGTMATLIGQTIGTNGFHCLGAILDGKVRHLPAKSRQAAKMHVWAQVHKAFSVVSAKDIPAGQLDSARNFIGSYALEGEWLPKQAREPEMSQSDWVALNGLICHMKRVRNLFFEYNLYDHFSKVGSPVGGRMIDHMKDGYFVARMLEIKHGDTINEHYRRSEEGTNRGLALVAG